MHRSSIRCDERGCFDKYKLTYIHSFNVRYMLVTLPQSESSSFWFSFFLFFSICFMKERESYSSRYSLEASSMVGRSCALEGGGDRVGNLKGVFSGRVLACFLGDPPGDVRRNFTGNT